jgi:hypothetical protein
MPAVKFMPLICFLHAENVSAAEIHQELSVVSGQNVMSEDIQRQLCRLFKDGKIDAHAED